MFLPAVRDRHAPAGALARVMACWLIAVLVVQGLATLQALTRGPAHRHVPSTLQAAAPRDVARVRVPAHVQLERQWSLGLQMQAHARAHQAGEPHHHPEGGPVVPADAEAGLDAGACALMASLVAWVPRFSWPVCRSSGRFAATDSVAFSDLVLPPPRRPPRA